MVGSFNTQFTSVGTIQKENKEAMVLNDTLDQTDLAYILNMLSKNSRIHIPFKYTGNISRIDHM